MSDSAHLAVQSTAIVQRSAGRRLLPWLGASLVAATIVAAAPASAQQLKEIVIGMPSSSLATALPRLAKEMGMFAKQGLEPRFVNMDNASVAIAALVAGSVPLTIGGPGELIAAQAQNHKVVNIATVYGGLAGTLVISKAAAEKSGVSPDAPLKDRLKALDGLVLAGSSATSAGTVALKGSAVKVAGNELRFVYIAQPSMPAALEKGAIQGFTASAPNWISPITKGTGVVWISGAKGELPSEFTVVSSSILLTMRPFAEANPDLIKKIQDVFADFGKAVEERPADVKAQIAKTYPDLNTETIDVFFAAEANAWKSKPNTAADMAKEIAFMKISGTSVQNLDSLNPAGMVYP